jgi:hypothetical protein
MTSRVGGEVTVEPVCELPDESDPVQWEHLHFAERFLLAHKRTGRWWEWAIPLHVKVSPWSPQMLEADRRVPMTQYDRLARPGQVVRLHGVLDDQDFWVSRYREGHRVNRGDVGTYVAVAGGQIVVVMSLGPVSAK